VRVRRLTQPGVDSFTRFISECLDACQVVARFPTKISSVSKVAGKPEVTIVSERSSAWVLVIIGIAAGVVQSVAGITMYLAGVYFAPWSMFVSVLVLLVCIIVGTRLYATRFLDGRINYKQALTAGIVISLATGLVYAVYNVLSISFFYPQFLDEMVRVRMAFPAADQQTHQSFEAMRAEISVAAIAVSNFIRLSVGGSILSAITAFFLKTER